MPAVGKSWYYLKSNGVMKTGWQKYKGIWYYLKPVSGKMAKSETLTIDGKRYRFNASGAWVK